MDSYTPAEESEPAPTRHEPRADRIAEEAEDEDGSDADAEAEAQAEQFPKPGPLGDAGLPTAMRWAYNRHHHMQIYIMHGNSEVK